MKDSDLSLPRKKREEALLLGKMLTSMPHYAPQNLNLVGFSPLKSSSFALFRRPFSLYPIFASSPSSSRPSRRPPRTAGYRRSDPSPRRKWSSFEERKSMSPREKDRADSFEFNKRRAEGLDKIDKPKKNLKRQTRTLNPTNTIAYVQVLMSNFKLLNFNLFKFEF